MNYINVVICPSITSGFWDCGSSSLVESFQDPGFTMKAQGGFGPHLWCWREGSNTKNKPKKKKNHRLLKMKIYLSCFWSFFFLKLLINTAVLYLFLGPLKCSDWEVGEIVFWYLWFERWLSGWENLLFFLRPWVWLPAYMSESS